MPRLVPVLFVLLHSVLLAARPNVLFIISDDLTATALSCYGNKVCKTPNIDRLAASGMRFSRAYCQGAYCGPSRASFLSGYYPHATGVQGYDSPRAAIGERATWPQHFRNAGYYAARISKIYHMGVSGDIEQGNDGADDPASWTERFNSPGPEWKAAGAGETLEGNPDGRKPVVGGNTFVVVAAEGDDLVHSDGKTAAKACELIARHRDEPFFLAVGFVRPHVPFVSPKAYQLLDLYPTTARLCGLDVPARLQGKDLGPILDDPSKQVRDAAFCVSDMSKGLMLCDDRWTFIQYGEDARGGIELFDMRRDPQQFTNLANSPAHAAIVAEWKARLAAKLKAVRDNDLTR